MHGSSCLLVLSCDEVSSTYRTLMTFIEEIPDPLGICHIVVHPKRFWRVSVLQQRRCSHLWLYLLLWGSFQGSIVLWDLCIYLSWLFCNRGCQSSPFQLWAEFFICLQIWTRAILSPRILSQSRGVWPCYFCSAICRFVSTRFFFLQSASPLIEFWNAILK